MSLNSSSKLLFWGSKLLLSSGREVELSAEKEENGAVVFLSFLNTLDPVSLKVKPLSVRFELEEKQEAIVSFECRGGTPGGNNPSRVPLSEVPIEGINGGESSLTMPELFELYNSIKTLYEKYLEREKNLNGLENQDVSK